MGVKIKSLFEFSTSKQRFLFILLLLVSGFIWIGCSPFIGCYNTMTNDYINIGKAMLDGAILHRDVIDHKGLYTFVPYVLFVCINRYGYTAYCVATFFGGAIFGVLTYVYIYQFKQNKTFALILASVTSCVALFLFRIFMPAPFFSADVLAYFVLLYLFWYVLSERFKTIYYKDWAFLGFIFGLFLWSKYSLVIFLFPFYVYVTLKHILSHNVKHLISAHAVALCAVCATTLPVLVYGIKTDSLSDMFIYYFMKTSLEMQMSLYLIFVVFVIFGSISLVVIRDRNELACMLLLLVYCSFVLANGNTFGHYILVSCLVVFPVLFSIDFKYKRVGYIVCSLFMCYLLYGDICQLSLFFARPYSIQTIAKNYDMKNSEILYFTEDYGFGSYSGDGTYKDQWLAQRVIGQQYGSMILQNNFEKIRAGVPKYIVIPYGVYPLSIDENVLEECGYTYVGDIGTLFVGGTKNNASYIRIFQKN